METRKVRPLIPAGASGAVVASERRGQCVGEGNCWASGSSRLSDFLNGVFSVKLVVRSRGDSAPGGHLQRLEAFWVPPLWSGGYWHLVGGGQGCCSDLLQGTGRPQERRDRPQGAQVPRLRNLVLPWLPACWALC